MVCLVIDMGPASDRRLCADPQSYTLFCLAWGGLTQGRGYDLANQTAYLDGTLRWGLDWLMKAHPANDILYVQVGDNTIDNNYWSVNLIIAESH